MVIKDAVSEPLMSVEPVTVKLPDMIAEPVYGNGSELSPTFKACDAVMAYEDVTVYEEVTAYEDVSWFTVPCGVVSEDTVNEPLISVEPVTVKLPDMIAEPVYGKGSM